MVEQVFGDEIAERRSAVTDEERQRQMDFILNQQAQFVTNMQKLEEADTQANKRIDRLERVLKLALRTGLRERKERRESTKEAREDIKEIRESLKALIASQTHTDQRLDALIDVVSAGRNGKS
jgi:soluble cytochrome b562